MAEVIKYLFYLPLWLAKGFVELHKRLWREDKAVATLIIITELTAFLTLAGYLGSAANTTSPYVATQPPAVASRRVDEERERGKGEYAPSPAIPSSPNQQPSIQHPPSENVFNSLSVTLYVPRGRGLATDESAKKVTDTLLNLCELNSDQLLYNLCSAVHGVYNQGYANSHLAPGYRMLVGFNSKATDKGYFIAPGEYEMQFTRGGIELSGPYGLRVVMGYEEARQYIIKGKQGKRMHRTNYASMHGKRGKGKVFQLQQNPRPTVGNVKRKQMTRRI